MAKTSTGRNTKQIETHRPRLHPFALTRDDLLAAAGDRPDDLHIQNTETDTLTVRLPSTTKEPLPSPELVLSQPVDTTQAEFKWWYMVTAALHAGNALDFLLALPDRPPTGIAFGSDLRFWIEAARFCMELLTRQSFVPTLHEAAPGRTTAYRADWEAFLSPEDGERMQRLARQMPPICWSFVPPEERNVTLLQNTVVHFLNQNVDAFIRGSLAAQSLLPGKRNGRQSLQEQWVQALASADATFTVPATTGKQFFSEMHNWLNHLEMVDAGAAFRTCFRLDPPDAEDEQGTDWHVSFHLQANDDRSLLVPAENVWTERSSTLTFLKRSFENPQERLLADLGKASRLFPAIEESLKSTHPQQLVMNTEQAYAFLRESAPLLEQSGFGVLVPPWWQKPNARLGVKLRVKPRIGTVSANNGLMGLDSLVDYQWQIAIGDATLSVREFEKLVNLKQPLIKIRGQWVELRPEQIEAAIAFFKKKQAKKDMSLGDALRVGLGAGTAEMGLPVVDIEAEDWINDVLERLSLNTPLTDIEVPATFHGQLRPYQLKGVSWMAFLQEFGFGACLADSMGLGKCVAADTRLVVNGNIHKAEDIWKCNVGETTFDGEGYWTKPTNNLLVNSIDEVSGQIVQAPIRHLYRQQVSTQLRKVTLEDGSSITITYPHKLLTDKGWTNDLHIGDYVCVPKKLLWEGQVEDPDLAKLFAWQIAEGYELREPTRVIITQKDTSVLDGLKDCLHRLSEKYSIAINHPSICKPEKRAAYLQLTSVSYRRFLESKGYEWGYLSCEKRIPDFIMQADLATVRIFLQNFFEAEASVIATMRSIEISTASPIIIQQLSYLLRRFGIWMRLSIKQKRATNGTGIYRPYQFGVIGGNAARIFCQEIGFAGDIKQKKLEIICESVNNTNVEGIPASGIVAQTLMPTKIPLAHFDVKDVYCTQQFSGPSLKRVVVAIDKILVGETEQLYRATYAQKQTKWTAQTLNAYANLDKPLLADTRMKLQHLLHQEVFYCRIKAIEEIQYAGWVYDFEVEEHHNFVANNIICHNTIQLITLLLHERNKLKDTDTYPGPTLLICPMSIVGNWQKELQRFGPSLNVMIHYGPERLSNEAFAEEALKHDIVITTYALALRDKDHLMAIEWENIVIDEAQNIKNETAKQTMAIKRLQGRHKIAMTGTPVENRLSELWSIMEFLNPGYLGSGQDFHTNFAIPIERYHNPEKSETLKRLIQPFVLRRLKTDKTIIQDLPDKMEMNVFCNLTREQASLYEAVVKEMMEKIEVADGLERRGLILAALTKLKQVCNHPSHFLSDKGSLPRRSGKLARLDEMVEEVLEGGEKALIFTQYAEMGHLLQQYLQERFGCEILFLHGGTPKRQRDIMVQRFQEERRGAPIFILSLKAGGVGLNLTAANHVFHFDRWWNPAVENQATDRAFRIGQTKNVQVHKFVCVGTLEERIDQMIEQKKVLAESIVGSGETWLTEMSTDQLKSLFQLSREAVGEE